MRRLFPLFLFVLGCGDGAGPDPCEQSPTYTQDVAPIMAEQCLMCHSQDLQGAARNGAPMGVNFNTYELLEPNIAAAADNITSGRMPPMDAPNTMPVPAEARRAVDAWRRCGYPK